MISKTIMKMISTGYEEETEPIFKVVKRDIFAGYRVRDVCVIYFLRWYDLVDGELNPVYMSEIPQSYKELYGCKEIILIGAFKNIRLNRKMTVIDIIERNIIGFINTEINKQIGELLSQVTTRDIIEEIEEIYTRWLMKNGRIGLSTWYPVVDDKVNIKNFIFVDENGIKEVIVK